jgi:hypothetical protein
MKQAAALSAGLAVVLSGFVAACGGNGNEPKMGNGTEPEIAFVCDFTTSPDIYIMNADGSSQRRLTSNK